MGLKNSLNLFLVTWVNVNLIKGRCFWLLKVPQYSTWSWRKILKLRDIANNFLKFQVGDGSTISLWMESWRPDGNLFDKYGFTVIYDARSKIDAKLSNVIRDWNWQPARFEDFASIQTACLL